PVAAGAGVFLVGCEGRSYMTDNCSSGTMGAMSAVDDFLTWAERDRNRSPATITRYRATLDMLARYADPLVATMGEVEAWWATRYDMSPSTRSNELACLRTFYKW